MKNQLSCVCPRYRFTAVVKYFYFFSCVFLSAPRPAGSPTGAAPRPRHKPLGLRQSNGNRSLHWTNYAVSASTKIR